jgi:hypothetical protein
MAMTPAQQAAENAAAAREAAELAAAERESASRPGIGETVEDAGRSFAAGIGRGAIAVAGLPADIEGGMRWLQRKLPWGPTKEEQDRNIPRTLDGMTSEALREKAAPYLPGIKHEPKTTVGEYARTTGEFIPPALVMGTGSLASRLGLQAAVPAVSSEAAGQATKGTALEPFARVAGAIAPAVAARAVTPFPASPTRTADVNVLKSHGVQPTAGQATGNRGLQFAESAIGGDATKRILERQGEQLTGAAIKKAGGDAARARPEVMDDLFEQVGKKFDDLSARTPVPLDTKLQDELLKVGAEYESLGKTAPIIEQKINQIAKTASQNGDILSGESYKTIRSEIGAAIKKADPETKIALRELQGALDDAIGRNVGPGEKAAWDRTRRQYKNLLVVEKAVTSGGEQAAQGIITPSALKNATINVQGRRNYARGKGDYADLARAGESVLKPLPDSGTASRAAAIGKQMVLGAGLASGDPMTILKAVGAAVAPTIGGRVLMTSPVQAYLGNQALGVLGRDVSRGAQVGAGMQFPGLLGRREDRP